MTGTLPVTAGIRCEAWCLDRYLISAIPGEITLVDTVHYHAGPVEPDWLIPGEGIWMAECVFGYPLTGLMLPLFNMMSLGSGHSWAASLGEGSLSLGSESRFTFTILLFYMYQEKLFIQNYCLMSLGGGNKSDTAQSERGIPPGYPPPWAV